MLALGEQWVLRMSAQLSADQRTVLLLRLVADLPAEQVAQLTGRTVGAVRALQRRGLEALRHQLARDASTRGATTVTGGTTSAGGVQR